MFDDDHHGYELDDTTFVGNAISYRDRRGRTTTQKPFRAALTMPEGVTQQILVELGRADLAKCKLRQLATFGAIFANLSETLPGGAVFYSRDRNHYAGQRRYLHDHVSYSSMIRAVDVLNDHKLIRDFRTRPSPRAELRSFFLASDCLGRVLAGLSEVQIVNRPKELIILRGAGKLPVDYRETRVTRSARQELRELNEFLSAICITLDHPDVTLQLGNRLAVGGQLISTSQRELYRVYTESFVCNGRFYGGFWQNLPSRVRSDGLRINGESVVELDYRACHLRILSRLAGQDLPFDDPTFDPFSVAGMERRLVKSAFVIMLNTRSREGAQRALALDLAERRGLSRPTTEDYGLARKLLQTVESEFPFSAKFWCCRYGLRLLYIDAEICGEVLRVLKGLDIPCLPVHDSFIVPDRYREVLAEVMENAFQIVMERVVSSGSPLLH